MTNLNFYDRQGREEEQLLYDHLLDRVQRDDPQLLLDDFRVLFIEGRTYQDYQIYSALQGLIKAKDAEERFYYCFNRCCHILVNRWQMQPQYHAAIPELVSLLENLAPSRQRNLTDTNRLRQLVKNFTLSDHYVKLQRLARIIDSKGKNNNSIGTLINRYPYLYDHCLLSDESSQEHQQTVRQIKRKTERRFEVNLSRYVTYKVRLAELARNSQQPAESQRIIQPVKNPTLLSDKELNKALKQYVGTVEGGSTYKSLSQSFITHSMYTPTYETFKKDLYEYLASSIEYGKGQFHQKLYKVISETLPQCNQQKPSNFLLLRTTSQLLNYLVVENSQNPQHYIFVDLISNMGVIRTVGLLMKLVLICSKVKPYLEKRFSILFNHYEGFASEGVPWLVKALESLQLAFSVNFGKADLSCLRQIYG
jgi:hypothetical protein